MADSFVYCWTDKLTNKIYVGVHKGSENDGYVCSSKYMLEEYNKRPNDFSRQIISNGCFEQMLVFETAILKSANAKCDLSFYNMHNGDGKFIPGPCTEETKSKIGAKNKNKKRTDEQKNVSSNDAKTRRYYYNPITNEKIMIRTDSCQTVPEGFIPGRGPSGKQENPNPRGKDKKKRTERTEKHTENLSLALKGREVWNKGIKTGPMSPESNAKKGHKGEDNPMFGKKYIGKNYWKNFVDGEIHNG
jgi:hypothetical protein